jgi:hypothetical protein
LSELHAGINADFEDIPLSQKDDALPNFVDRLRMAFDESGERTIKIQTLDEFIAQAAKAISEAETVLATQTRKT